ncbi:macro domain-containing protein [Kibdelosporangium aridum]|uniref:O-acetyl-ADP-ribose deacetylase (Regulator of RNase III), contains Macro domain n=1 Tax=Kibdelosporangium aridum TaxID=2030 RepID=A0A1W2FZV7_KIBAR|nr:macro domain-containing protein [Kibdelosporangium aridum]SMD27475.1 O-acetyl-ADP-ribose deacetylase (regulator of RNase III), contains Macro domain [Kibdelosporangium aridum]
MGGVFVNYRVREQPGYATLLHRELAARLGPDRAFLASRSIRPGDDFVTTVFDTLRRCDVLLAVMGPQWIEFLTDPERDWVHREIQEAFSCGLRVIPVLVEDAELPDAELLPGGIAALARCQAVRIRHYSIDSDLDRLIRELGRTTGNIAAPDGPVEFRLSGSPCGLEVLSGSIRRVRTADTWVNSENTDMKMARHNEFSVSGIIRYWGAIHDDAGRVVDDLVADELETKVREHRPVAPGTVVITGAGALRSSHNVKHIIHVAAVHGEPGAGYRQVLNISWCVTNVLTHAERLTARTVLFPLLGTGVGGAEVIPTAERMVTAAIDYLRTNPATALRKISFLGFEERERQALIGVFADMPAVIRKYNKRI